MYKLIAVSARPGDPEAFLAQEEGVHTPLVRRIPGRLSAQANRVEVRLLGEGDSPFLIAELCFADKAAFDDANLAREPGGGPRFVGFAAGRVTLLAASEGQ